MTPATLTDALAAAGGALAVAGAYRASARLPVPPLVVALVAAALVANLAPGLSGPSPAGAGRLVAPALAAVLYDGGLGLGRAGLAACWGPVLALGLVGTAATAAAAAAFVHTAAALGWYPAILVGAAIAPTDPAVVFSVLGRRRPAGRSGWVVEGESGANDPVGIALVAALVSAGSLGGRGWAHTGEAFARELAIGAGTGLAAAAVVALLAHRPAGRGSRSEAGPRAAFAAAARLLAEAAVVFGAFAGAERAGGSGYLAVFAAGALGAAGPDPAAVTEQDARRRRQVWSALAGLGEVVAFAALGSALPVRELGRVAVLGPGLALGLVLTVAVRPAVTAALLLPSRLASAEKRFVAFAGLKGAVPILLGGYLLRAPVPDPARLYGMVVVATGWSVLVIGGLTGPVIERLGLPADPPG
jgi:cell volume regulation protein A